jgi:hypothetical protein
VITEFEPLYRLLDLPEDAQSAAVRDTYARRLAALEEQQASAGSKPERLMAKKSLRELADRSADVQRLAACLEVAEHLAEARAAIAERRGARAKRALGYAAQSAAKTGLDACARAVSEVEDEFADSGLARDSAIDTELARIASVRQRLDATLPPPARAKALPAALADAVAEIDALLAAPVWASKPSDPALTARLAAERETLGALRAALAAARSRRDIEIAVDKLEAAAAAGRFDAAFPARLAEIETAAAAASYDEVCERCALLRRSFEHEQQRRAIENLLAPLEAAVAAGNAGDALTAPLDEVQNAARAAGSTSFDARIAAVRHAIDMARRRSALLGALEQAETEAAAGAFGETFPARLAELEQAAAAATMQASLAPRLAALHAAYDAWKNPPPPPPPPPPPVVVVEPPPPPPAPAPPPEPAQADRFTLTGPEGERCHVLCAQRITFGRSRTADIVLRACHPADAKEEHRVTSSISRVHFVVDRESDDAVLVDGGPSPEGSWKPSANGTLDPEGRPIDRVRLFRSGLAGFSIVKDAPPVASPQWDVKLQMRAPLPPPLAALRDALPRGPDALHLERRDGLCEDVLVVWRAASLQELGLTDAPACIVRHKGGFLLWQDGRLGGIEIGFRVGTPWSVGSFGKLSFSA